MARGWIQGTRLGGWLAATALAAAALASSGCAIHTQGPIKEVAYDFSDRDFYDRAYAPSPKYLETDPPFAAYPVAGAPTAEGAATVDAVPVSRRPAGALPRRPAAPRLPASPLRTSD